MQSNVKKHKLKVNVEFCDKILSGIQTFIICEDNRDFQVGDKIIFSPEDDITTHEISEHTYEIKFVFSGSGVVEGWIALGFKEISLVCKLADLIYDMKERMNNSYIESFDQMCQLYSSVDQSYADMFVSKESILSVLEQEINVQNILYLSIDKTKGFISLISSNESFQIFIKFCNEDCDYPIHFHGSYSSAEEAFTILKNNYIRSDEEIVYIDKISEKLKEGIDEERVQ